MKVSRIRDGLWRWEVPHPDGSTVASVYAEYDEAIVLIDPLIPAETADQERFFAALDRDVSRLARPVLVLVGSVDHGRSADTIAARYLAAGHEVAVVGDAAIRDAVSCALHATFEDVVLPTGLHAVPISGLSPGERAFVLDPWRAVVFADAAIGAGEGRLRVAPPSWGVETPAGRALYDRVFRPSIQQIASAQPEIVLPSHGEPVLTAGASALDQALAAPAWGE